MSGLNQIYPTLSRLINEANMKLADILNTEEFTTHDVTIQVKGGDITLKVTDKFTPAWNAAQLQFSREQSQLFLSAPKGEEERRDFVNNKLQDAITPLEVKLYSSLVSGWSLDDELTAEGVSSIFTTYPTAVPAIDQYLRIVEHNRNEEKKSLLKPSDTDSSKSDKVQPKTQK